MKPILKIKQKTGFFIFAEMIGVTWQENEN